MTVRVTVYLVDYENTGPAFADAVSPKKGDIVEVFCPQGKTLREHLEAEFSRSVQMFFVKTDTGKNALDFQLATWLGHEVAKHPERAYVIVSNDNGYRAVAAFWERKAKKTPVSLLHVAADAGAEVRQCGAQNARAVLRDAGFDKKVAKELAGEISRCKSMKEVNVAISQTLRDVKASRRAMAAVKPLVKKRLGQ